MGQRSFADRLPDGVRAELEERVRRSGFGDIDGVVSWLAENGVKPSRSSVHRYIQRLREREEKASTLLGRAGVDERRDAAGLLMELGALRVRETEIIGRLRELGVIGTE